MKGLKFARGILSSFLAVLLSSGCALTTYEAEIGLDPETMVKSPLSTIEPLKVDLKVQDNRNPAERDKIGMKKNTYGMELAPVVARQDVTEIIREALNTEFANNGHQVLSAGDQDAQLIVEVDVNKFWSDMKIGIVDVKVQGIISTQVTIIDADSRDVLASEPIDTTATRSEQIGSGGAMERALVDALGEYVSNFSRDPTIIEALRMI
jgi:uncharacterized lipoprotein